MLTSTVWADALVDNPPGQAVARGDTPLNRASRSVDSRPYAFGAVGTRIASFTTTCAVSGAASNTLATTRGPMLASPMMAIASGSSAFAASASSAKSVSSVR